MTDQELFFDPADIQKNKAYAALAYLGILFFIPLVACPDSKFGRFHANQGLLLLLLGVVGGIFFGIFDNVLGFLPIIPTLLTHLFRILCLVLMIIGIYNGANGKAKELPVIGTIRLIK